MSLQISAELKNVVFKNDGTLEIKLSAQTDSLESETIAELGRTTGSNMAVNMQKSAEQTELDFDGDSDNGN